MARRNETNCKQGFDLIIIDVDDGVSIDTAKHLLADYTFLIYTTKRHTASENRFRMVFPMNYHIKLDAEEYKEFMLNFYDWLPFDVDRQTNQRARKWLSHKGYHKYNYGELVDARTFIPKTKKAEEHQANVERLKSMNAVERWFASGTRAGNRSNNLIRYAYMLVDNGMGLSDIQEKILNFNRKLENPLEEAEVLGTIMVTTTKAIEKRNGK